MIHDPSLAGFGAFLNIVVIVLVLSIRAKQPLEREQHDRTPAANPRSSSEEATLRQQCLQLRAALHHQKAQLAIDFQDDTFDHLQTLLTNYPTAKKMAEANAELPARNLIALFSPLENLLQSWEIQTIGTPWEQVSFNSQLYQADAADISQHEQVYVRFVGYRQGDRILCPAKVSRTLPERV